MLIPMPKRLIGKYRNGQCTEPCDMLIGPCACGAWHRLEDWPKDMQEFINPMKVGYVPPVKGAF